MTSPPPASAAGARRGRARSTAIAAGAVAIAVIAAVLAWRSSSPPPIADPAGGPPTLSLLALGDTGKRHKLLPDWTEGQIAVAQGMVAEDRRRPVDALVLLGDNFYMKGLQRHELVERVRMNVVRPYCHFLALDGARSAEVAGACQPAAAPRHPVPIYALLGNHDLIADESPALQRDVLPEMVPGWRLARSDADVVELQGGVSLILLASDVPTTKRGPDALRDALRRSRGPWRIVAAHRPAAIDDAGGPPPDASYYRHVGLASQESGVPIHLFLAGHHHSLQVLALEPPAPRLNIVVGSGSRHRPIEAAHPERRFGESSLGFARVDLIGAGRETRLVASLFRTPSWPFLNRAAPELVARWSVDAQGALRDELVR